jgi:DNA polymerase-1
MKQKIMVIDSFSLLYKAFYGVRPMSAADGTPTNAIYGFINMLLKWCAIQPRIFVCGLRCGQRDVPYARVHDYKAGRQSMPEDLAAQVRL